MNNSTEMKYIFFARKNYLKIIIAICTQCKYFSCFIDLLLLPPNLPLLRMIKPNSDKFLQNLICKLMWKNLWSCLLAKKNILIVYFMISSTLCTFPCLQELKSLPDYLTLPVDFFFGLLCKKTIGFQTPTTYETF